MDESGAASASAENADAAPAAADADVVEPADAGALDAGVAFYQEWLECESQQTTLLVQQYVAAMRCKHAYDLWHSAERARGVAAPGAFAQYVKMVDQRLGGRTRSDNRIHAFGKMGESRITFFRKDYDKKLGQEWAAIDLDPGADGFDAAVTQEHLAQYFANRPKPWKTVADVDEAYIAR